MRSAMKLGMFVFAACAASAAQGASEYRYTMLFSGHVGGEQVTRIADDGSISSDFSYRENGRGPDYKEKVWLAADGTLRKFAITGTSTFGSQVNEHFERKGDRAEWAGIVDRGSMKIIGPAMYVPIDSTLEVASITLRALIHAPSAKLPGIPGGELSVIKLTDS